MDQETTAVQELRAVLLKTKKRCFLPCFCCPFRFRFGRFVSSSIWPVFVCCITSPRISFSVRILILTFLFRSFFSPYNTLRSKCIWASFFRFFFHVNESFNFFVELWYDRLSAPVAGNTRSDSSRSCQDVTQRFGIDRRREPIVMVYGDL